MLSWYSSDIVPCDANLRYLSQRSRLSNTILVSRTPDDVGIMEQRNGLMQLRSDEISESSGKHPKGQYEQIPKNRVWHSLLVLSICPPAGSSALRTPPRAGAATIDNISHPDGIRQHSSSLDFAQHRKQAGRPPPGGVMDKAAQIFYAASPHATVDQIYLGKYNPSNRRNFTRNPSGGSI